MADLLMWMTKGIWRLCVTAAPLTIVVSRWTLKADSTTASAMCLLQQLDVWATICIWDMPRHG